MPINYDPTTNSSLLRDVALGEVGIERQRTLKEYNKRKIAETQLADAIEQQWEYERNASSIISKLEAQLDALKDAIRNHIEWAHTQIDCEDLLEAITGAD